MIDAATKMLHSAVVSKFKKLYQKLKSGGSDANITFDDADYLLAHCGFQMIGGKGSHHVYHHEDGRKVILPFHGKDMKTVYVKKMREVL